MTVLKKSAWMTSRRFREVSQIVNSLSLYRLMLHHHTSESQVLTRPAMVRTGSSSSFRQPALSKNSSYSSRFETLPSASPSTIGAESPSATSPPQFGGLPPDMLSNLLSPSNSATLAAFMQLQNISAAPPSAPIASTSHSSSMHLPPLPPLPVEHLSLLASPVDSAHLLKNSHHPFAPSPDFSALLPSFSESPHLNPDYSVALQENNEILREAMTEKTVIDAKTTEIETAIAKLLQTLPPETRAQLNQNGQLNASGFGFENESVSGSAGDGQGMRWGDENLEGDFLSQYGKYHVCLSSQDSHLIISSSQSILIIPTLSSLPESHQQPLPRIMISYSTTLSSEMTLSHLLIPGWPDHQE